MNKNSRIFSLYNMYREQILYIVFGVLTTVISIAVYAALTEWMKINFLVANIISWIIAVLFAFVTNRKWVFETAAHGAREITKEMFSFYAGRLLTLGIEEIILFLFIDALSLPNMPVKIAAQLIVIILNYIISKFFVFRKKKD